MRADRLVATLLLLQARGRVTAAEVAEELEISVATARRDLEALSLAGIPVYPRPGRGGGWSLVGGARTDLSGLTAAEARALFTLVGPSAAVVPEARAALRKLVQALPETFRADARAAADAVVIDSARWGDQHRSRPPLVDALQAAVVRRRRVRLLYDRHRHRMGGGAPTAGAGPTAWLVDPHGLVDKDDVWYLVAGTDRGRRTFRVDRIVEAEVTDEPADRPDDFDLGTAWRGVVDEVEERRSLTAATVVVAASLVPVLRGQFGRHCTVEGAEAGGRARVRVAAPTPLMIAQHLAGWGAGLDVVGPEAVQAELARIGAELISRYAR